MTIYGHVLCTAVECWCWQVHYREPKTGAAKGSSLYYKGDPVFPSRYIIYLWGRDTVHGGQELFVTELFVKIHFRDKL